MVRAVVCTFGNRCNRRWNCRASPPLGGNSLTNDEWLAQRRKEFVEHLLTLGPILGIALAFLSSPSQRALLAQDLVLFVISALSTYVFLILEIQINKGIMRVVYSFTSVGVAFGFGFLLSLTASFYGSQSLQNFITLTTILIVSVVLVLPFRSPTSRRIN
jgi:hypothetical protein